MNKSTLSFLDVEIGELKACIHIVSNEAMHGSNFVFQSTVCLALPPNVHDYHTT